MKCRECGTDFTAKQYNSAFCCTKHKMAFNNRRAQRGAILYDLAMIERYDIEAFKKHDMATVRVNFLDACRQEDEKERASRSSWKRVLEVAMDLVRFR